MKKSQLGLLAHPLFASLILSTVLLAGCLNPNKRYEKAIQRVETAERKIATNQVNQTDDARQFIYAADVALQHDDAPSQEVEVAKLLTQRSILVLGVPEAADALEMQAMVNSLLSSNRIERQKGDRALAKKDAEMAAVQAENHKLVAQLNKAESKLTQVNENNAGWAGNWASIRNAFWWLVFIGLAIVGIQLAWKILPIIIPALSPYKTVLGRLVGLIQRIREDSRKNDPSLFNYFDAALKQGLPDEKSRKVITAVKQDIGIV